VKVYSSPVDQALLSKFQKLTRTPRKYQQGSDSWYSYSKLNTDLPVFSDCPGRVLAAKISRISVKKYQSVAADHGWHSDSDVPVSSIRILIPIFSSGEYQMQLENSLSWNLETGRAYAIPATELHRLILKTPGTTDFFCIVLDIGNKNGKRTRNKSNKNSA
jgi:hypothetical protein